MATGPMGRGAQLDRCRQYRARRPGTRAVEPGRGAERLRSRGQRRSRAESGPRRDKVPCETKGSPEERAFASQERRKEAAMVGAIVVGLLLGVALGLFLILFHPQGL